MYLPIVPILRQKKSRSCPQITFLNSISVLSSYIAGSYTWPLSFRFPHQPHVCIYLLSYLCHMPNPYHPLGLDLMILILCGKEHKSWSCTLCSSLQTPVTSLLQGKNITYSWTSQAKSFPLCERLSFTSMHNNI